MISGVRTIGAGVRNHKMISAVIGRRGTSAAIANPTLTPLRYKGKYPVLDLRCELEDGSKVDVEILGTIHICRQRRM